MKIALTMALLLVLSISLSSAITYSMEGTITYSMEGTQENINSYNSKIDNAPDILKRLVGNEKINIDVIRNDGSVFRVGFVMENARINQAVEGGFSDASIILTTTENAVNTIRSSDNPIDTFQKQEDLGQVRIEGDNLLTKAK
ncbi:MAG: hypothetical protein LUQ30_05020, partial [Methanothrix sp.]|nr:hypothetical protein [Methanothrix sp.]